MSKGPCGLRDVNPNGECLGVRILRLYRGQRSWCPIFIVVSNVHRYLVSNKRGEKRGKWGGACVRWFTSSPAKMARYAVGALANWSDALCRFQENGTERYQCACTSVQCLMSFQMNVACNVMGALVHLCNVYRHLWRIWGRRISVLWRIHNETEDVVRAAQSNNQPVVCE